MPESAAVNAMFGRIARRYDLANRVLSGGVDLHWRRVLLAAVKRENPKTVLDLATGSGDVAFALARGLPKTTRIVGIDFCQPMLDEAMIKKAKDLRLARVEFEQGDALSLAWPDQSFDAITISFGLRNFADRPRALSEMRRLLRPGGKLFLLEFSQPDRWFRPFYYFYLMRFSPWVAGMLTGDRSAYSYLGDSIEKFPNRAGLAAEISAAGFSEVQALPMTFGIVALHEATR